MRPEEEGPLGQGPDREGVHTCGSDVWKLENDGRLINELIPRPATALSQCIGRVTGERIGARER